jgi:hypothetical protein
MNDRLVPGPFFGRHRIQSSVPWQCETHRFHLSKGECSHCFRFREMLLLPKHIKMEFHAVVWHWYNFCLFRISISLLFYSKIFK